MIVKTIAAVLLSCASIHAMMYACINQSGFDVGAGNMTVDLVANGNFCYIAMDNDYTSYAVNLGLNIERKLVAAGHFKLYGMCGAFLEYDHVSLAYVSPANSDAQRQVMAGLNVLCLRPEVVITPRISLYCNLALIKYEASTETGYNVWIVSFLSSSTLQNKDAVPQIGFKFYF